MQTCDTLLHAGVLLTQDDDRRVLENAALAIDGGRIVALGYSQDVTAAWQAREILDLSGMLVMPGLVNAHTHAAMTSCGAWPTTCRSWTGCSRRSFPWNRA